MGTGVVGGRGLVARCWVRGKVRSITIGGKVRGRDGISEVDKC